MNFDHIRLEPRVEELLLHVAAKPDSTLLRTRPRSTLAALRDSSLPHMELTGLDAAEKELARVFECELSALLQDLCAARLLDGSDRHHFIGLHEKPGHVAKAASIDDIRARLQAHRSSAHMGHRAFETVEALVHACIQRPGGDPPSIYEVAVAAHRIKPDNRTRLLATCDLLARKFPYAGVQIARTVLEGSPTEKDEMRAWECIGSCEGRINRFDRALDSYRRACTQEPESVYGWMNRFFFALWMGQHDEAKFAAEHLNAMLDECDEIVNWYLLHLRKTLVDTPQDGDRKSRSRQLSRFTDGAAGRISRAVLDVISWPCSVGPPLVRRRVVIVG